MRELENEGDSILPPLIDPPLANTHPITSQLTGGPGEFAEEE